jgi:hypothetical protein
MTGSRVKQFAWALAAVAVFAAPVVAQWTSDKPPVLTPDDYPPVADGDDQTNPPPQQPVEQNGTATAAPQSLPGAAGDQSPTDVTVSTLPNDRPAVQVGSLGTAEGPPVGTLDSSNGGLGENIWDGSDRATAEDLLIQAPLVSADPAMRSVVRRIVLTKAAAPSGPAKRAFVTVRIEKLLDAGLIEQAGALAAQAAVPDDMDFARVQADALLIANRANDVCGNATAARLTQADPFWLELRAYCAAVSGDQPTADLTNSVRQAQGASDPGYDTLVDDVINHKTTQPGPIAHPTAMHIYLFQQASLPIPGSLAAAMGTPENLLVMRDGRNDPRVRFEAAERIARTGAASISELKLIADALDLPLSRVANAAADAPNLPFFMGQVLLRRGAVIQQRPDEKAKLAFEALMLGDKQGLLPLSAALQSDIVASLKPSAADNDIARVFARSLLLAGHTSAAARWTTGDPVMQSIVDLASSDPTRSAGLQAAYSTFASALTKNPAPPDADRSYKALVLGIANVLGKPMPADAAPLVPQIEARRWDGIEPDPGVMRNIERVSLQPDRRGEALLMIVDTIHKIGLRDLAPDATVELVRLVGSMGLPESARALGLDALMQYVPPPAPPGATATAQ